MTVLRQNFDGGAHNTGFTVANSGNVPGNNAMNAVDTHNSSGRTVAYWDASSLGRATAEFVLKTNTTTTSASCAAIWNTAMGSQSQVWWRQYLYLTAYTPTYELVIWESDNGAVYTGVVGLWEVTGELVVRQSDLGGPEVLSTNPVPLNEWFRLEGRFQYSTTTGNFDVKLFLEPDSEDPTETISATNFNLGASSANSFAFGSAFQAQQKPTTYYSGWGLSNEGWLGPAPFRPGKGVPGIMTNPVAIHTNTY